MKNFSTSQPLASINLFVSTVHGLQCLHNEEGGTDLHVNTITRQWFTAVMRMLQVIVAVPSGPSEVAPRAVDVTFKVLESSFKMNVSRKKKRDKERPTCRALSTFNSSST
jgi:hypothetical protein